MKKFSLKEFVDLRNLMDGLSQKAFAASLDSDKKAHMEIHDQHSEIHEHYSDALEVFLNQDLTRSDIIKEYNELSDADKSVFGRIYGDLVTVNHKKIASAGKSQNNKRPLQINAHERL